MQLISGLELLHDIGVCHKNLSLKNILVYSDAFGEVIVKLADFGLSIEDQLVKSRVGQRDGELESFLKDYDLKYSPYLTPE